MVASSTCIGNHMCRDIPVHATLTGKSTMHDTNMTLFQPIWEGFSEPF